MNIEPEARHRACWYSRRTADIPSRLGLETIEDGQLLYCSHPMWFPVVGYRFDVRNCAICDFFKAKREERPQTATDGGRM
jgi:hypothetical protein